MHEQLLLHLVHPQIQQKQNQVVDERPKLCVNDHTFQKHLVTAIHKLSVFASYTIAIFTYTYITCIGTVFVEILKIKIPHQILHPAADHQHTLYIREAKIHDES